MKGKMAKSGFGSAEELVSEATDVASVVSYLSHWLTSPQMGATAAEIY
jgi:hypothetical protein